MKRLFLVGSILTVSGAAMAARIWTKQERVQLSPAQATSFNGVLVGAFPTCTNWRRGHFRKECDLGSGRTAEPTSLGTCTVGSLRTVLYPDCRYTPSVLTDVPDGFQLETE